MYNEPALQPAVPAFSICVRFYLADCRIDAPKGTCYS